MHARIQDFFQGGWGVQAWRPENSLENVFFLFFLVLNLFYSLQRGSNGFITGKLYFYFSKDPEGVQHFPEGGGPTFSQGGGGGGGGSNTYFYRNPYNLWFSRGGGGSRPPIPPPPPPPLWIRTCKM